MKVPFKELCFRLEQELVRSYSEGVSLTDAEKLAGQFLHAQMQVSTELAKVDLDARMRKSGLKAIKAAVYIESCRMTDKKPTESSLEHTINSTPIVNEEQGRLDEAETSKAEFERYYDIFREAHVYFRQMSKGVPG